MKDGVSPIKIAESFPFSVREIRHCWIPVSGGDRLAARIWIPEGAEMSPVPAIVEYIPYRKSDYTAVRDQAAHGWFAGHGYACIRVDVRGTGDSDGLHTEQWSPDYDRDAQDVFQWIAAQPWCDGNIGMIGLSWGGQACLRMASLAPSQLKAVLPVSAADDRYANKYLGGCLLVNSVTWANTITAQNTRPPDPTNVGDRWHDMWLDRLEHVMSYLENWLHHSRRDAYWYSGTVMDRFHKFDCPVYIVGGGADPGYADTVPRLLANLKVPVKGLIGPWAHKYPHYAIPGPGIGFLQEAVRWFDRWLKGVDNGVDTEPRLRVWMHEFTQPKGHVTAKRGYWVAEDTWPSERIKPWVLNLNGEKLQPGSGRGCFRTIRTAQSVGFAAGEWMPWFVFGRQAELPLDQREDDVRSVVFDTDPLEETIETLGNFSVSLDVSSDKPIAILVARLCDVAPDGTSMRVTYGALNLTRYASFEHPQALVPGRRYRVNIPLYVASHAFTAGHRIRLALSTTYWPVVWPGPTEATVTLYYGSLQLSLRQAHPEDRKAPFGEPMSAAPMMRTALTEPCFSRRIIRDLYTNEVTLHHQDDSGVFYLDAWDLECAAQTERMLRIIDDDPLSARSDVMWRWRYRRGSWDVRTETRSITSCTATAFNVETTVEAFEGDRVVFSRSWRNNIPRELV